MSNSDITIAGLHPDATNKLRDHYNDDPEFVNYLLEFGNEWQRAAASVMKRIATVAKGGGLNDS